METKSTIVGQGEPQEPDLSAKGMRFLTGGLASEGDTFLIGAAAVLLTAVLYPLVGPWSLLAFVVVPAVAIVVRRAFRRRNTARY
jgi:hypothetical protein